MDGAEEEEIRHEPVVPCEEHRSRRTKRNARNELVRKISSEFCSFPGTIGTCR